MTPNAELAWRVIDHIDTHPEQWDQTTYYHVGECGTTACFAGWALLLSGIEMDLNTDVVMETAPPALADSVLEMLDERYGQADPEYPHVRVAADDVAEILLGLTAEQATSLFHGLNGRAAIGVMVDEFFGPRPAGMHRQLSLTDDGLIEMTPQEIAAQLARDPLGVLVHVAIPPLPRPCGAETGQEVGLGDFLRVTCPRCEEYLRVGAARLLAQLAFTDDETDMGVQL